MDDVSNRTLALLLVAAIAISLGGTFVTVTRLTPSAITAQVTEGTALSLTVDSITEVNWTPTTVAWGTGIHDASGEACDLDTNGLNGSQSGSNCTTVAQQFTTFSGGLNITNNGNTNVTLNISCGKNAAAFLGGTSPGYTFNITNLETDACSRGSFNTAVNYTQVDCSTSQTVVCNATENGLGWTDTSDQLLVHFYIHLPKDVVKEAKSDTVTLTAFELPD